MAYSNIDKPSKYFDTQLFTGTNTSGRTFTGLNFQPDMIWGKQRDSASYNHFIVDVVRGGTKFIATNSTASEDNKSHGEITSWNSDGTTWADGTNATYPRLYYNDNGQLGGAGLRVWWQWKAGNSSGSSNTSGTITSTVSANTTSGFSIVSYTGNGSTNQTVGHGLGATPDYIIVKARSTTMNWPTYSKTLGNGVAFLDVTDAWSGGAGYTNYWYTTGMTSSTFGISNNINTNTSSATYIAYCFTAIKGFSKFGTYTGNGSSDGTFVYTGFKPAFILVKASSTSGSWYLQDSVRNNNSNGDYKTLQPNTASTESTIGTWAIDSLSNGFKLRESNAGVNGSGTTYIYMAFASNPFVSSKGLPTTAR